MNHKAIIRFYYGKEKQVLNTAVETMEPLGNTFKLMDGYEEHQLVYQHESHAQHMIDCLARTGAKRVEAFCDETNAHVAEPIRRILNGLLQR